MKKSRGFFVMLLCLLSVCFLAAACSTVQMHIISFECNGGTPVSEMEWEEGTELELPIPERAGYDFIGWYYDAELKSKVDPQSPVVDGDVTLYAAWEKKPQTYLIQYDTMGGDPLESDVWTEGESFTVPQPNREGYRFLGWFFDSGCTLAADFTSFVPEADTTLYAAWEYIPKSFVIRLYTDETTYTTREYIEGSTVDISEWETPDPYLFEGDHCPFLYWIDETYTSVLTENFIMPSESMAFYAVYDMPQMYRWSYDPAENLYTSTGAGVRPVKNTDPFYYGEFAASFTVRAGTTGIGIVWNAAIGEVDYPYDYSQDCSYWYFHLNPSNGGFQLAKVDGAYTAVRTISLAAAPASWQEKWSEFDGKDEMLSFEMKVEFLPSGISLYIDGALLYAYTGEELNTMFGGLVGFRTNATGNTAKVTLCEPSETFERAYRVDYVTGLENVTVASRLAAVGAVFPLPDVSVNGYELTGWYLGEDTEEPVDANYIPQSDLTLYARWQTVEMRNGYKIYDDSYVYNTQGVAVIAAEHMGAQYGMWSADFTATSTSVGRIGLLVDAEIPERQDALIWTDEGVNGYLLYQNLGANKTSKANFTISKLTGGKYESISAYSSASAKAGYGVLQNYYERCRTFFEGESDVLTVRLGIAVTATRIAIFVDGVCLHAYANPGDHSGTQVGFFTEGNGMFSGWKFEQISESNGFLVMQDEDGEEIYVSAPVTPTASVAVTVPGISGRYGRFDAIMSASNIASARVGLLINAHIAESSDGSDVLYSNSENNAYYLHHNLSANANFTLASIVNGKYTTGGSVKNYNASTEGVLGEYFQRCAAFLNGESAAVTVTLSIEVTEETIRIYIDGECVIENSSYGGKFDEDESCVGIGFLAYGCGTSFRNIAFTPVQAAEL